MKLKIPETHIEHLKNVRRDLYIRIGIDARDTAFDYHEYKISKTNHINITEYNKHRVKYDNEQISPYEAWQHNYTNDSRHVKVLIKKLFSIPYCQNKKLEAQTLKWLKASQWLKIADTYDHLQSITDAPEAHWRWRNAHESPGKMAPEQKRLLNEDIKTGIVANRFGYQIKHFSKNKHHYIAVINKRNHQAQELNDLPKELRQRIIVNLSLANYLFERK